jgi:hypothetical protein
MSGFDGLTHHIEFRTGTCSYIIMYITKHIVSTVHVPLQQYTNMSHVFQIKSTVAVAMLAI